MLVAREAEIAQMQPLCLKKGQCRTRFNELPLFAYDLDSDQYVFCD